MISTVTSSTVTAISSVVGTGGLGFLGLAAVLAGIAFLMMKVLVTPNSSIELRLFGHYLDVAILPLVFVFGFILIEDAVCILIP